MRKTLRWHKCCCCHTTPDTRTVDAIESVCLHSTNWTQGKAGFSVPALTFCFNFSLAAQERHHDRSCHLSYGTKPSDALDHNPITSVRHKIWLGKGCGRSTASSSHAEPQTLAKTTGLRECASWSILVAAVPESLARGLQVTLLCHLGLAQHRATGFWNHGSNKASRAQYKLVQTASRGDIKRFYWLEFILCFEQSTKG